MGFRMFVYLPTRPTTYYLRYLPDVLHCMYLPYLHLLHVVEVRWCRIWMYVRKLGMVEDDSNF